MNKNHNFSFVKHFPAPAPNTPESQKILADTRRIKILARARRWMRWLDLGLLPPCARAEAHLVRDLDAAMTDKGFDRLVAAIDAGKLLDQMASDVELGDELSQSHIASEEKQSMQSEAMNLAKMPNNTIHDQCPPYNVFVIYTPERACNKGWRLKILVIAQEYTFFFR